MEFKKAATDRVFPYLKLHVFNNFVDPFGLVLTFFNRQFVLEPNLKMIIKGLVI